MNKLTIDLITTNLQQQITGNHLLPLNVLGVPGIGKSATITSVTQAIGSKLLNVSIPTKSIEYFTGIPQFINANHMAKYSVSGATTAQATQWTVAELIYQANTIAEQHGSCVVLLDDCHELNKSTAAVLYEFLLERKLHDFKLHDNVAIILAQNDSEESGAESIASPLKSRMKLLTAKFDFEYWFSTFGRKLHHYIASFLKLNPQFANEAETISLKSTANPRAWTDFSAELELHSTQFILDNVITLALQSMSKEAATEFAKHIVYMEKINFEAVIKSGVVPDIESMEITDQVLYSYILNYSNKATDAVFLINLLNKNSNSNTFIGYIALEMYTKFLSKQEGKPITPAQSIIIDKLLGQFDVANYKLPVKLKSELTSLNLTDRQHLLSIATKYKG